MYKNLLHELAQRCCFKLPSYAYIREGPDHAPRFKASVNYNGEIFESPSYCPTLRQAEHAAAEVALNFLSTKEPSRSLTARFLDETGIYKNLLQKITDGSGLNLPIYTTVRSSSGHIPTFTSTVELAGMNFKGEPAKTKKQAEKNAAMVAFSALNEMPKLGTLTTRLDTHGKQEQANVTRVLSNFGHREDGKQVKRRDQKLPKRIIRDQRNIGSLSPSTSKASSQNKRQNLLMDYGHEASIQKPNTFAPLFPSPPPRTASKILAPTPIRKDNPSLSHCPAYLSNRHIPVQRSGSNVIQPSLVDYQKVEEEWLGIKPDIIIMPSPFENGSVGHSNSSFVYETSPTYEPSPLPKFNTYTTSPMSSVPTHSDLPRTLFNGPSHLNKIAPAVHTRSVIPVCAAPPPSSTIPPTVKVSTESASYTTLMSMQPGVEDSSPANSKYNTPHFSLFSYDFSKFKL